MIILCIALLVAPLGGMWLHGRFREPASCRWRGHDWRLRFRRAFHEWVTCRACGGDYIGDIVEGTYIRCRPGEVKEFRRGYEHGVVDP